MMSWRRKGKGRTLRKTMTGKGQEKMIWMEIWMRTLGTT